MGFKGPAAHGFSGNGAYHPARGGWDFFARFLPVLTLAGLLHLLYPLQGLSGLPSEMADAVNAVKPDPNAKTPTSEEEVKGLAILTVCVDAAFRGIVMGCTTLREAWEKLCKLTAEYASGSFITISRQFNSLQMLTTESFTDYHQRTVNLANTFRQLNRKKEESEIVLQFVTGLPTEYADLRTKALMDLSNQTMHGLLGAGLLLDATRPSASPALFSAQQATPSSSNGGRPILSRFAQFFCKYCGKRGHIKPECKSFKRDKAAGNPHPDRAPEASGPAKSSSEQGKEIRVANTGRHGGSGAATLALVSLVACCCLTSTAAAAFPCYLDSGSVHCIVNSLDVLTDVGSTSVRVLYGNGSVQLNTTGTLTLATPSGIKLVIANVLYDPSLPVTCLLSERALDDAGLWVPNTPGRQPRSLVQRSGSVVAPVVLCPDRQLWRLEVTPVRSSAPAPAPVSAPAPALAAATAAAPPASDASPSLQTKGAKDLMLWHQSLGHVNAKAVADLGNNGKLPFTCTTADIAAVRAHCSACLLGKSTKQHLGPSTTRAPLPGEYLHSDLQGPFTIGHNRTVYHSILVDDFSRYSFHECFSRKSEAAAWLQKTIAFIETQTGNRVKGLRTDNAKEYVTTDFTKWLESKGIKPDKSLPHTPEQNGIVERRGQTCMNDTRTALVERVQHPTRLLACRARRRRPHAQHDACRRQRQVAVRAVLGQGARLRTVAHARLSRPRAHRPALRGPRSKLNQRAWPGRLIGYPANSKG
jgi:hypothetical protein